MVLAELRAIAAYRIGRDLSERLAFTESISAKQSEALAWSADEIERLTRRVEELEAALVRAKTALNDCPGVS